MLLKRIPDSGLGSCFLVVRWGCSHTPGHGFDRWLLIGHEARREGTAPALQNVTERKHLPRYGSMTDPGQRHNVAEVVLRWTYWSRDGIPCESLVKPEGGQRQ